MNSLQPDDNPPQKVQKTLLRKGLILQLAGLALVLLVVVVRSAEGTSVLTCRTTGDLFVQFLLGTAIIIVLVGSWVDEQFAKPWHRFVGIGGALLLASYVGFAALPCLSQLILR